MLTDRVDEQLVSAALMGDESAFGELAHRYRGMAFGAAFNILSDFEAARDAAQDSLVRAYLELPTLREHGKFAGWLYQIARMVALGARRSRRHTVSLDQEAFIYPYKATDQNEKAWQVRDALGVLSENDRLTVILHYVDGYTHEEIGGLLGVSPATIKTRLHRVRCHLREELLSTVERNLKDERSTAVTDIGIGIQWFGTPCHCHCRHCSLESGCRVSTVPFGRVKAVAERFLAWRDEQGLPDFAVDVNAGYSCDFPQLQESKEFNAAHGATSHFVPANGIKFRSEGELREFFGSLVEMKVEHIGVTFYGLRETHDAFCGRDGDFDYMLLMSQVAAECGLERQETIFLTHSNTHEIPELVGLLDGISARKGRGFYPWDYRGRGKSLEKDRVTMDDFESMQADLKQYLNLDRYASEAEWIKRIQTGRVPQKTRRYYLLSVWEDNIAELECMDCGVILQKLREEDERLHQAIPSLSTLAREYGRKSGQKLYKVRDLEWKWIDLYLRAHPEVPTEGRFDDSGAVILWH